MRILTERVKLNKLKDIDNQGLFEDMVKCVADIEKGVLAVSAELHSDLEELLLENGSNQKSLYGFNIFFDDGEIEYDSLINPPRNREDGYPRGGRNVASSEKREKIKEIVEEWIEK